MPYFFVKKSNKDFWNINFISTYPLHSMWQAKTLSCLCMARSTTGPALKWKKILTFWCEVSLMSKSWIMRGKCTSWVLASLCSVVRDISSRKAEGVSCKEKQKCIKNLHQDWLFLLFLFHEMWWSCVVGVESEKNDDFPLKSFKNHTCRLPISIIGTFICNNINLQCSSMPPYFP